MNERCPSFGGEGAFSQDVCELLLGADEFYKDAWVQPDTVEEPIKVDAVSAANVSQVRAATLNGHLNDSVVVLQRVKLRFPSGGRQAWRNVVNRFESVVKLSSPLKLLAQGQRKRPGRGRGRFEDVDD